MLATTQVVLRRVLRGCAPLLAFLALAAFPASRLSAGPPVVEASALGPVPDPGVDPDDVTYSREIARIFQENCQVCHRPGAIGPMSLLTYDEVRPWAAVIREVVRTREMPPYHYDTDVGIQELKYDPRLSEEEIEAVVAWVDAGAPEGDPADLPPPAEWPDPGEFRLAERFGPPDLIVRSAPYDVPAVGQDRWWQPIVETGLTEDRCIRAIETKPSVDGVGTTHHANSTFVVRNEEGDVVRQERLSEYALGKIGEIIPEGACRIAPASSEVSFDIHYFPNGVELQEDQVEIGLWLHPRDYEAEYEQTLSLYFLEGGVGGRGYDIPPHGTLMTRGYHTFDHPVRIDSFQPHGHLRLVAMQLEILRNNGRKEMVSLISNWNPGWHHSHIYEDDVAPLLDVGEVLVITGWYDNTANNRYNPDPDQWVGIGDRTADEMSHAWIAVTHLDQEGYEELLAERDVAEVAGGPR
jgi:mono/diheme cytochrome c family protein